MTLYAPLFLEAVTGDAAISYHMQDLRLMISALAPVQGTILATDLAVSQRAAGTNMSVDVAAGRAIIQGTSIANQGSYIVRSDAVTNVGIAAANGTNPRIDLIVARVLDKQSDGGSSYSWTLQAVTGTPAASPVAPAVPASSLLLAQVAVAANAASITAANVTDMRQLSGQGDVPKWDFSNTTSTPQSIPGGALVLYQPTTRFQQVGVNADATNAVITCLTPGRYVVHLSARYSASASSGPRTVSMKLYSTTGVLERSIETTVVSSTAEPVTTSGTIYMRRGEQLRAYFSQNASGAALTVDDSQLNTNFTGVWVGP